MMTKESSDKLIKSFSFYSFQNPSKNSIFNLKLVTNTQNHIRWCFPKSSTSIYFPLHNHSSSYLYYATKSCTQYIIYVCMYMYS